jgi:hypothetical protein
MSWHLSRLLVALLAVIGISSRSAAWEDPHIVQVEEDWELQVQTPDPLQDAPQISTWMSPTQSLSGSYFGLDLNHMRLGDDVNGGFQTKAFEGEVTWDEKFLESDKNLQFEGEVVRWTQVMAVRGGRLYFSLKDGTSQSWGAFGGAGTMVSVPSSIPHLDQYSPEASLSWSGIGFASNRVAYLKLVRIRKIDGNGNVTETAIGQEVE